MHSPRHAVIVRSFSSFSSSNYATPPKTPRATLALTFFLGSAAGAAVAYTFTSRERQKTDTVDIDDASRTTSVAKDVRETVVEHDALTHGWPLSPDAVIQSKPSYACAFDGRTRNSRWVLEKITPETLSGPGTRKKSDFYEDDVVSWKHRSTLKDYRGSGYDRGHLVAAADQKGSQEDMNATFSLMNISPQVGPGFNRDYWAKLEEFVRDAVSDGDGRVAYVATGPLFLPSRRERESNETQTSSSMPKPTEWEMRHPMLGEPPAMVSVPTHFYKVVLVEDEAKRVACAAFVLPNAPIPKHIPLRRFVVPLTDLEIVSGLEFFKRGLRGDDRSSYERAERSFLASTAKQLPGSGKIPSLPANASCAQRSSDDVVKVVGKRWAEVKHLCDVVACEIPAKSKWELKDEARKRIGEGTTK